ncbi:ribonuclease HI [Candidatus Saccharibacteria bacterium]|nr:ribonuclease HI [Candidatus Saccharibacteria bacterium]
MRIFYTDGSCSPNPGPGGFAVIENSKPVALGKETSSTNIRMEAEALIAAMKLANGEPCKIHTDSEFWINVITKWAPGWREKGWKKSSKGEIQNLDLVKNALEIYEAGQVELIWVKAHVGHDQNELADEWANKARKGVKL